MADIQAFIRELAGKAKAKPKATGAPKVLEGRDGVDAIEGVLAQRQGDGARDAARVAYDKARQLHMPTIDAALEAGRDAAKALVDKLADVEEEEAWEDWQAATTRIVEASHLARDVLATHRKAYEDARKDAADTISQAIGLTEIGGGAVASSLAAAVALANAGEYRKAMDRLAKVRADAEKVNARAPFVRACRRHQPTIKAAFAITHEGLGKAFEADWDKAVKIAESGDYHGATKAVEELSDRVETAKASPQLKDARTKVAQAREQNVAAMQNALKAGQVDVQALRALVVKEIGGGKERSLASQANELGDDPAAKTREPIGNDSDAEENFMNHDWFKLKEMLHEGKLTTEQMWDCWRYRQQFVTRLIDALRKKFPTLIAKTSGSTDLESDIDITFASSTPGDDVKAATQFNAVVKAKFKKPPGRVFDVNIYPRDYNAISESINTDYNLDPVQDRDIDQPTGAMQKLSRVDQDVATLLKQRRFLDDAAFKELMDSVVASAGDAATRKQITKQFEEGEDIYLVTAFDKVDRIKAKLLKLPGAPLDEVPLLKEFDALRDKGDTASLQQAQKLLPRVLDQLEKGLPAEVMEATDEMYLEKMATLRVDQTRIERLDDPAAEPGEHHEGGCEQAHKGQDHEAWRKAEAERLKAKVKKDQFTNIVFANEAYMSQGAIEHIVAGVQAKDAQKKAAALAKLTPATLMQSCNEQLADFFKDMKASKEEVDAEADATKKRRATGEAFVHASKYLVRLLDAAQILSDKFAAFDPPVKLEFDLLKKAGAKTPQDLMKKVEAVLLALRKSSTVPAGAKGEVGVDEAQALFGVKDVEAFRTLISAFGAQLNQQVRNNPEFKAELAVDLSTERQYFGVPETPAELKAVLDTARGLLEPMGEAAINAAIGEAEGEAEAAQELIDAAGNGAVPKHLAARIEDTVARGQQVLSVIGKSDVKDVLKRAATIVRQAPGCIDGLEQYDAEPLHDAQRGDIARALAALRERVALAEGVQARMGDDLKSTILQLNGKLAALKKLLAQGA